MDSSLEDTRLTSQNSGGDGPVGNSTKPTLLRIGGASALPVLLCGMLQQQQRNLEPMGIPLEGESAGDVEKFEEEFMGLMNQRYAQMMSACPIHVSLLHEHPLYLCLWIILSQF